MAWSHFILFFLSSVFSCSSVLDSLLFKPTEHETIQSILLKSIVNPLRKWACGLYLTLYWYDFYLVKFQFESHTKQKFQ